jgi:hypothetical protein
MVVVRKTPNGAYILSEMDGSVSKLRFAAFRVIPYYARKKVTIDPDTFFHYSDDSSTSGDPSEDEEDSDVEVTGEDGFSVDVDVDTEEDLV